MEYYLPIQKSLKILPNISSTSTFPTIIPKCRVANLKSSAALSKSCSSFFFANISKSNAEDFDKAAEDLRLATRHLGMIVGKVDVEEILGSIFNDFCIGK